MRKIAAYILGSLTAFIVGLSILPPAFESIIEWLGPLFGESLRVLLSMLFILMGDPFKFTSLSIMWASISLICGLIVRKVSGSLISVWLIYLTMFMIAAVSALGIFEVLQETGMLSRPENLLALTPPIPPDISLSMIVEAPIVGNVFSVLQKTPLPSLSSPVDIVYPLVLSVSLNILKNVLIILVFSLMGCEIGKAFEKFIIPKITGKSSPETREPQEFTENLTAKMSMPKLIGNLKVPTRSLMTKKIFSSVFLGAIISASTVFPVFAVPATLIADGDEPYYAEGIFCFATQDGTAYLTTTFVDSEASLPDIDLSAPQYEDALAGILISHDTSSDTLPPILSSPEMLRGLLPPEMQDIMSENITRYYEVVPSTLLVLIYLDVPEDVAMERADLVAGDFSSGFSASLSYLISTTQTFEVAGESHTVTNLIYQSPDTLDDLSSGIIGVMPLDRRGLTIPVNNAFHSGIFDPGSTPISSNGTIMMTGFFSSRKALDILERVGELPIELVGIIIPNTTRPIVTIGIFAYWLNRFHSSAFEHILNVANLLNVTEPIEFSPEATVSVISLVAPNATITDGKVTSQAPVASIILSVNLTTPEFEPIKAAIEALNETVKVNVKELPKGSTIKAEDLAISFVQILPIELYVYKQAEETQVSIGEEVKITITILNKDVDAASNVTLDDSLLLSYYGTPSPIEIKEGSLTKSWDLIPGNSTVTHSYTLIFKREGFYTIPYTTLNYNYMNMTFTAKSKNCYVRVKGPSNLDIMLSGMPRAWGTISRMIDKIPGLKGMGTIIFSTSIAIIIGLVSYNEYKNIRKWLKSRREREREVTIEKSEESEEDL
ncbi:TPA: hypothetical protein EYP70_06345 [Candidatus Bathyarchaeota archaeon]|nr:hypothetical protein [Candidatus Bathyarchaeota archaeon]